MISGVLRDKEPVAAAENQSFVAGLFFSNLR